ncbi:Gfo/Idh/MocA family protein [Geobacter argillaceus]|uniref:Putative dehydrogenase n=1 Tax=Geobacter argillaceus TaxID=345631 RepID=A0A562V7Z3_9BACT|nr:Gfo/Idh/MocA family oxidoreductase [Geobacter argillaceus]TWJ14009.1 putative dehydrogenase [Geobacter argillaceus]
MKSSVCEGADPKGTGHYKTGTGPVRIAVIGAGLIGLTHLKIIRRELLCEIVALVDPMPAAATVAAEQGIPCFSDHVRMLEAVKPDGVVIATPNALHVPVGLACAERGVHMLVEKPIADTVEAAQTLVEAAERAGVELLVGHHRRYNPIIRKARDIIQSGGIGRLTAVTGQCLMQKPENYFDMAWRRQAGGGPVLINMIHDIDNLRFVCGEIATVQAVSSNAVRGFAVEDTAAAIIGFANGALATLTISDAVATPWSWDTTAGEVPYIRSYREICYFFAGTEGGLSLPKLQLWSYKGEKGWGAQLSMDQHQVDAADPQTMQMRHFCRVIRGEEKPVITGADATRTLAATLAVKEAAETGCSVNVFG